MYQYQNYNQNEEEFMPDLESPIGIIGQDTRVRINDTSVAPFKYVCQIRIGTDFERPINSGTGFVIGPRTVLTAAHVVFGYDVGKIWVIPARNSLAKKPNPFGIYAATDYILSKNNYKPAEDDSTSNDYAIIHLHEDISLENINYGHWGLKPNSTDQIGSSFLTSKYLPEDVGIQKINICGYPKDKGGNMQYLSYNKTLRFNKEKTELYYLNDIIEGTSGSPIWIRRSPDNGGRVLVGINIAIEPNKARTKALYNVGIFLTDSVRSFIKANTL
jgi:glutamyl endopeptidase